VTVLADPAALELVVANLLTSALKHSPPGGEITLAVEQVDDVGVLKVGDLGEEVEERDLSSSFVEFEHGLIGVNDDPGNGLVSVQRLIDLQGGTVALTSHSATGTTVAVRLQRAPEPSSPMAGSPDRLPLVRPRRPSGSERAQATRVGVGARNAAERALADLLEQAHVVPDYVLPELFERYGRALGAHRTVAYLVDLQQRSLAPFTDPRVPAGESHADVLSVDRTLAGRAFQQLEVVTKVLDMNQGWAEDGLQVWLPLVDGSERLGVLAVTLPDAGALEADNGALRARLLTFASVAAELIVAKTKYGDSLVRLGRSREMTLSAEMQRSLLPPLTFVSDEVTITGGVEPAYEVGGDTLDYAVDPGVAHLAVFDGMGHGLPSAQLSALALSAYRNARRGRQGMVSMARFIDTAISSVFGADAFATGVVVQLDTQTGVLQWINAGHPAPLLLRNGRLVRALHVEPLVPFGLGSMVTDHSVHIGREHLEPGDMVLLHSDGVTEARSPVGGFFGTDQLVELVTRHLAAGLPPSETMRRVTSALLEHHYGRLSDDASLLLLQYRPHSRTR
jgi:serine phosphatase RsbU (regulator of sigma subunit)